MFSFVNTLLLGCCVSVCLLICWLVCLRCGIRWLLILFAYEFGVSFVFDLLYVAIVGV